MKLSERMFSKATVVDETCAEFLDEFAAEVAQLKEENAALKLGVQDIRNISGTEWGRCEKDSPWGKALFWIMQKCEALLTEEFTGGTTPAYFSAQNKESE